jgi:hypothetical protein
MPDRIVHGVVPHGGEIVRYDRRGKWYLEVGDYRIGIEFSEAVRLALLPGATVHPGLPGGRRFDAALRRKGSS